MKKPRFLALSENGMILEPTVMAEGIEIGRGVAEENIRASVLSSLS